MAISPALVLAYAAGRRYRFVAAASRQPSYFGGPLSVQLHGKGTRSASLHQIAYISAADIPLLKKHHVSLPLLYGLRLESQPQLQYRLKSFYEANVLKMPKPAPADWPYRDYPPLLPYVQLELAGSSKCTWKEFSEFLGNAPDKMPADVFIAVPPPMNIGMSLWGRMGDEEGVTIVWEVDLKSQTFEAYNICT